MYDAVPMGDVSVRRGDQVYATDGAIGRVQGFVIDPRNSPCDACAPRGRSPLGPQGGSDPDQRTVTAVDAGIQLTVSKAEIKDLPAVDIDKAVTARRRREAEIPQSLMANGSGIAVRGLVSWTDEIHEISGTVDDLTRCRGA